MAQRTTSYWIDFFLAAGLPQSVSTKYAMIFTDHRIQEKFLEDLTKDMLYDMGIKTIGDIIAILKHAREVTDERIQRELMSKHSSDTSRSRLTQPSAVNKVSTTLKPISGPSVSSSTTLRNMKRKSSGEDDDSESGQPLSGQKVRRVLNLSDGDQISVSNNRNNGRTSQRTVTFPGKYSLPNAHQDDKNKSVFNRLGGGSNVKKDIIVTRLNNKPSTLTRVVAGGAKVTFGNQASSSVKDRLSISKGGSKGSGLNMDRKVVSTNIKSKQAPQGRTISLKKSVYDRLGPKTF